MKTPLKYFSLLSFLLVLLVLFSCSKEVVTPKQVVLTESVSVLTRQANDLKTFISASGIDLNSSSLKYDAEIFKVKYKTTYKDQEVIASGLVILPKTGEAVGIISFQHGTLVAQKDAPTALPLSSTELVLYAALSSSGFVVVVPDYIGFGESKNIFHPYYVEQATSDAVIDNIKAAGELASKKGNKLNKKLFLAGYSQGGYATMAAHKAIETNGLDGFNLMASFPASGGYNVKGMQEYFFAQQDYNQPHYLAYVAMSYQSYYGWTNTIKDFFQEPFATRIPGLFNGINGSGDVNAQLTDYIPDLLNHDLINNINTDQKYAYLVTAFNENSLLNWSPKTTMYMYHGTVDTTVPYQNSVATYDHFIANGTSADVIKFIPLPGADHYTGVVPYIEDFTKKLLLLQ